MKNASFIVVFVGALSLGACGGGGGGDGVGGGGVVPAVPTVPGASQLTFNVDSAFQTLAKNGYTKSFSSVTGSCSGTAELVETPASGSVSFELRDGPAATRTFTSAYNAGCPIPNIPVVTSLYYDNNYLARGFWTEGNVYAVYTAPPKYPTSAKVGTATLPSIGTVGTLLKYRDSTRKSLIGKLEFTYRITADTETTAILTITGQNFDASSPPNLVVTQEDSYRISATSTPTLISMKILDNTGTKPTLLFQ